MNDLEIQTSVAVRIIGKKIDFNNVLSRLPIEAQTHRKGEILYKKYLVENDTIIFNLKTDKTELLEQLEDAINVFENYKLYLEQISHEMDIILRIYMQSNMCQLYSYIPIELLIKISDLSMSLEFSVWSEGMVNV